MFLLQAPAVHEPNVLRVDVDEIVVLPVPLSLRTGNGLGGMAQLPGQNVISPQGAVDLQQTVQRMAGAQGLVHLPVRQRAEPHTPALEEQHVHTAHLRGPLPLTAAGGIAVIAAGEDPISSPAIQALVELWQAYPPSSSSSSFSFGGTATTEVCEDTLNEGQVVRARLATLLPQQVVWVGSGQCLLVLAA